MKTVKYFIVDDHTLFRQGIKMIFANDARFELLGESGLGEDAIRNILHLKPDVVLLDVNLPDISGFEVCTRLKSRLPSIKVLVLSMHEQREVVHEMLKCGADGYLVKNSDSSDVKDALIQLVKYGSYTSNLMQQVRRKADEVNFSKQEIEILKMICEEKTTKLIAEKLGCSLKTVELHRQKLLIKTDSKNMAGLVKFAIKNGIDLMG
jgi:DNA-binding NarL/FixJ family response regulator